MLEILRPVVDSRLPAAAPYRKRPAQPPGPPHRPGKGGHRVPQTPAAERVHDARASPHRLLLACHRPPPLGRRNSIHIPAADPPRRACGQPLNQRYNAQHHTPQGGAVQPLADPVSGPCPPATCSRPPRNPGRAGPRESGPGRPHLDLHYAHIRSQQAAQGAPAGRTSTRLSTALRRPSAQKAPSRPKLPRAGSPPAYGRQPSQAHSPGTSTLTGRGGRPALRRWMVPGSECPMAEPACCHRAAMRIIIGRGGSEASGGGRRRSRLARRTFVPARH